MRYATERFSAQPNTSVYIEAGAADWLRDDVAKALRILVPAGIGVARGFALNSTHYDSTARQIRFAADISRALEARGIPGKFAVVNTARTAGRSRATSTTARTTTTPEPAPTATTPDA